LSRPLDFPHVLFVQPPTLCRLTDSVLDQLLATSVGLVPCVPFSARTAKNLPYSQVRYAVGLCNHAVGSAAIESIAGRQLVRMKAVRADLRRTGKPTQLSFDYAKEEDTGKGH